MFSKLLLFFSCFITCTGFGQTNDTLNGSVTDRQTREAIPFAQVTLKSSDSIPHPAQTDIDGKFRITGLLNGYYLLHVSYPGYNSATIRNVVMNRSRVFVPVMLIPASNSLPMVTIVSYREPLIDPDTKPSPKHKWWRRHRHRFQEGS